MTATSEVAPLGRVVLKHARDAFESASAIERQWRALNYSSAPDFDRALAESDALAELLTSLGVTVELLPRDSRAGLDSIYVRDASIMGPGGAILCRMGKEARSGEPAAQGDVLPEWGVAVRGTIEGDGRIEGGDVVWFDARTVAVGRGYRTNDAGVEQLRGILESSIDELVVVPLPHYRGPGDVFHLMSIISPIDHDLALVYSPLMPVVFREWLLQRGIELVEVPDDEFDSMGCNVLTVSPRRCVMLSGNPLTRERLRKAGAEVFEYSGEEISRKGAGGPTCLTRPIVRTQS